MDRKIPKERNEFDGCPILPSVIFLSTIFLSSLSTLFFDQPDFGNLAATPVVAESRLAIPT